MNKNRNALLLIFIVIILMNILFSPNFKTDEGNLVDISLTTSANAEYVEADSIIDDISIYKAIFNLPIFKGNNPQLLQSQ